jgi:hypothetical protein
MARRLTQLTGLECDPVLTVKKLDGQITNWYRLSEGMLADDKVIGRWRYLDSRVGPNLPTSFAKLASGNKTGCRASGIHSNRYPLAPPRSCDQ